MTYPEDSPTLRHLQREVDEWISQFEEGYFGPLSNLARLVEEVGELSRELNHRFGEKKKKEGEAAEPIDAELGDILFVVICLANQLDVDLDDAFARVLEKYEIRDADRWTKIE